MENIIILAVVAAVVALAGRYIYRSKKSGKKCIGCPDSGVCSASRSGCGCGCGGTGEKREN